MTNCYNGSADISSVELLSHVQLFATPWTAAHLVSLSKTNSRNLLKLRSNVSVMPFYPLILCHPLSSCLQSFPESRPFQMSQLFVIRWPKCWSFSFSIHTSNVCSGLIFFSIDCFDLLAVQGTLKNLLQHHSLKATVWLSAFFIVQPLIHT